ncbi:MAG: CapA family protein [Caldilineaceae bacterium]|nr:CapA family protein [Caldilineaceae bacterium]
MPEQKLPHKVLVVLSAAMIVAGVALALWALNDWPAGRRSVAGAAGEPSLPVATRQPQERPRDGRADSASDQPAQIEALPAQEAELAVEVDASLPPIVAADLAAAAAADDDVRLVTDPAPAASAAMRLDLGADGRPVYTLTFAAVSRFDTVDPSISWIEVQAAWATQSVTYTSVAVLTDTLPVLTQLLGERGSGLHAYATVEEVEAAAWQDRGTLAILPFEMLTPRLVVFTVDRQNPVENANRFDASRYPLSMDVYAHITTREPAQLALVERLLAKLPPGNRDPGRLTVIAMTGVTAMCRMTAQQMDRLGPAWPAEVVGPELASADITHISNEVPFLEGCETNPDLDNLNFCSKPEYFAALEASGVDIIGLTGNHQNDFGRQRALESLAFYKEKGLPVYGGGANRDEAFKPYFVEHNGNRLAFLGANSFGPNLAWATDNQPGAAPFDLNILSATIRSIKEKGLADVVLAELQYQESYDTQPLVDQRQDFNALVYAGADIVTGVQSHVPQGMEFTEGKLVLYGLGNLYFDQMWSQATREGMIVKHTIYRGRHISTQVLTTLLYDFGQPRWSTPAERASLLQRVFNASYW